VTDSYPERCIGWPSPVGPSAPPALDAGVVVPVASLLDNVGARDRQIPDQTTAEGTRLLQPKQHVPLLNAIPLLPSQTPPQRAQGRCKPSEVCGNDGLCWPSAADAGPTKLDSGKGTCPGSAKCSGGPGVDCSCEWSCPDGKTYKVYCKPGMPGSMYCKCYVNALVIKYVHCNAAGTGACTKQLQCCGFPS
jgi:hypothetical protein